MKQQTSEFGHNGESYLNFYFSTNWANPWLVTIQLMKGFLNYIISCNQLIRDIWVLITVSASICTAVPKWKETLSMSHFTFGRENSDPTSQHKSTLSTSKKSGDGSVCRGWTCVRSTGNQGSIWASRVSESTGGVSTKFLVTSSPSSTSC